MTGIWRGLRTVLTADLRTVGVQSRIGYSTPVRDVEVECILGICCDEEVAVKDEKFEREVHDCPA